MMIMSLSYSSGQYNIKVTNRGQWMQDKWNLGKKGYLKIHVAVDTKTKEILALSYR